MRTIIITLLVVLWLLLLLLAGVVQAGERDRDRNYILRRQEIGAVRGTPTLRLIYGRREIDVYRNGLMFEKDQLVGVRKETRR